MTETAKRDIGLKNVDHEDAILRTFILFVQAARAVLKYADTHLYRKERISTIKLIVLKVLASNNGIMMPSQVAEWTQTERHNITMLLARMKRDGLVTTERNSGNKRLVNVALTDKGRDVLKRAMQAAEEVVKQTMLSISEEDAVVLEKILAVLRKNAYLGLEGTD